MTNSKAPTPTSVLIPFHGDALRVCEVDGVKWVAVKPICEHLGVNWASQYTKLVADEEFNCCDIAMVAEDGKQRPMTCLNLDQLLGWLYTINAKKVKAEVRPLLKAYKAETTRAINDYWTKGQATRDTRDADPLGVKALRHIVEEFEAQSGRLDAVEQRLDTLPVNGYEKRQIFKLVHQLAKQMGGKRPNYPKAWRTLNDKFGIVTYTDLPAKKYDEALRFLRLQIEAYGGPGPERLL